jgi:hypothetical protein
MIKSRMMRWAGHVVRMGKILVGKPEETIRRTQVVGGKIISKWILER